MTTIAKRKHAAAFEDEGPAYELLQEAIVKARSTLCAPPEMPSADSISLPTNDMQVESNSLVAHLDLTENGAIQFQNTGYAPLDLFFCLVRSASSDLVEKLACASWSENAAETIKILMHARDARSGKGERSAVLNALLWLRRNKPLTYILNLNAFVELGYFKDLLNIAAACQSIDDKLGNSEELLELQLLAAYLRADLERLANNEPDQGEKEKISLSLAAKYAPSEGRSFDKKHKFATRVARLMFPEEERPKKRYRAFLARARSHINVVECPMSNNQWTDINFGQVPARAHRTYRNAFKKHEEERYAAYLAAVREGKDKINTTGTQPHELVKTYLKSYYDQDVDETVEAQWEEMVNRLKSAGGIKQSVSVVDVSGSMYGQPVEVAVALGLITAELNSGPYHNRVITFSSDPEWEIIRGDTLREKVSNLSKAHWEMSTNLEKVFDLILSCAIKSKCTQEELPQSLFIFSDMQFDQACRNPNTDTLYRTMRRKYLVHNYLLPNVIFWNLRSSTTGAQCPDTMDESGTALVSGFSAELLKLFLDGKEMNPMTVLRKAIEPYEAKVEASEI